MNEVDEANEADRYLSECQKAMKDLKSERERYEKMIREIDADIGSVRYKQQTRSVSIQLQ